MFCYALTHGYEKIITTILSKINRAPYQTEHISQSMIDAVNKEVTTIASFQSNDASETPGKYIKITIKD